MIYLSQAAVSELNRLKSRQKLADACLRLEVLPRGCSGLSYQFNFDQAIQPDDRIYEANGMQVVVNTNCLSYLDGLTLDYSEDLMGGAFRFYNPNAAKTCDCGISFSVDSPS